MHKHLKSWDAINKKSVLQFKGVLCFCELCRTEVAENSDPCLDGLVIPENMACSSLVKVDIRGVFFWGHRHTFTDYKSLTHITIPDTPTEIEVYEISECATLATVAISKAVNLRKHNTFFNQKLSIYYAGTEE